MVFNKPFYNKAGYFWAMGLQLGGVGWPAITCHKDSFWKSLQCGPLPDIKRVISYNYNSYKVGVKTPVLPVYKAVYFRPFIGVMYNLIYNES